MLFAILKLSQVQVAIGINLHTRSKLLIIGKLALINFAILPHINSISMSPLLFDLAKVNLILILDQFQVGTLQQLLNVDRSQVGKEIIG